MIVFRTRNDPLVRTSDGRHFITEEEILVARDDGAQFRVPVGSLTDGASIPQPLWSTGLTPFGPWWLAAVLHDSAYRGTLERQTVDGTWVKAHLPRDQADLLLLDAMTALGVEQAAKETIYDAVRLAGGSSYHGGD